MINCEWSQSVNLQLGTTLNRVVRWTSQEKGNYAKTWRRKGNDTCRCLMKVCSRRKKSLRLEDISVIVTRRCRWDRHGWGQKYKVGWGCESSLYHCNNLTFYYFLKKAVSRSFSAEEWYALTCVFIELPGFQYIREARMKARVGYEANSRIQDRFDLQYWKW